MNRRKFLKFAATLPPLVSGALAASNGRAAPAAADTVRAKQTGAPLFIPGAGGPFGVLEPKGGLKLAAELGSFPLAGGKTTPFLWYRAKHQGKDYQNPILKVKAGQRLDVTLANALNEPTIIHWHGLHLPGKMDGHPGDSIGPKREYRYAFTVKNRGGTYWYHTHAHQLTAEQAYFGLASFFLVEDDDERALREALDLELGVTDLPLVIQDKRLNGAGEFVYNPNRMERMMGYLGDVVLANLTPAAFAEIGARVYRFRLLNGSNARIYKPAFVQGGRKLTYHVIGTDGGLLDKPYPVTETFLAPGERLDVLLDAGGLAVGDEVRLQSLAFDPLEGGGMMGMMMGRMSAARLPNGETFDILKLKITKRAGAAQRLPARLSRVRPIDTKSAAVRPVRLEMARMRWLINGESFRMDAYPIEVRRNTVEIWEIRNAEHSMPHPMHLHGFQFQVLARRDSPAQVRALGGYGNGRAASDLGWKDTVLVWPGETVRLAVDFSHDFGGDQVYVFHCHNLEHEDNDMMVNLRVRA
ncbi:MAG: multicopper oxidase family protein [Pseudomonadota bacterium]|jgi:suppressor of ftsI/bilirubin oxidase